MATVGSPDGHSAGHFFSFPSSAKRRSLAPLLSKKPGLRRAFFVLGSQLGGTD